jgi:dsDNA-specific endonuclease/ATPase MutS2
MRDFLAYAEFESFWERFLPETPFGREEKEKLRVLTCAAELEAIWDETSILLEFLAELDQEAVRGSRVTHHLKRLPRFPEEPRPVFDEVELFQFKKFLHNYKCLGELLSPRVREAFAFSYRSEGFERLLEVGRQSAESFFVSDEYSEELSRVRADLRSTDASIRTAREERAAELKAHWGLEFGSRDFLLVPRERLADPASASGLLLIEPYDETKYSVRLRGSADELLLAERRAHLLTLERSCEEAVLEALSHAAREELPRLLEYREVVRRFDLALARARLARDYRLVRPVLAEGAIRVQGGRFLPCEEACRVLGTDYTPMDAVLDSRITVLFGSNMGGKTIVLKTFAFLQLCAQSGLFAPAEAFQTALFQGFHYLGEGCVKDDTRGLSGFGFEIRQLTRAYEDFGQPTLALFDEFARTTNSHEAEAILSAVIESLAGIPGVTALFSTHFRGIQRISGVRFLRMQGLDREGLELGAAAETSLDERIRLINGHMEHRLVADEGDRTLSDAITVAGLLGLSPDVTARANDYFQTGTRIEE